MGMDALVLTTVGRKSGADAAPLSLIFPTATTPGSLWHRRMVGPTIRPGITTSPPIPTKSELRWPVARLPSVPNRSTDSHANRRGDVSRTNYRVSRSTHRRPTASCRSFVCKPVQHPVPRGADWVNTIVTVRDGAGAAPSGSRLRLRCQELGARGNAFSLPLAPPRLSRSGTLAGSSARPPRQQAGIFGSYRNAFSR